MDTLRFAQRFTSMILVLRIDVPYRTLTVTLLTLSVALLRALLYFLLEFSFLSNLFQALTSNSASVSKVEPFIALAHVRLDTPSILASTVVVVVIAAAADRLAHRAVRQRQPVILVAQAAPPYALSVDAPVRTGLLAEPDHVHDVAVVAVALGTPVAEPVQTLGPAQINRIHADVLVFDESRIALASVRRHTLSIVAVIFANRQALKQRVDIGVVVPGQARARVRSRTLGVLALLLTNRHTIAVDQLVTTIALAHFRLDAMPQRTLLAQRNTLVGDLPVTLVADAVPRCNTVPITTSVRAYRLAQVVRGRVLV